MIEALWSVEFSPGDVLRPVDFNGQNWPAGFGILVLETERVFGGDVVNTYIGSYKVDRGEIEMRVRVKQFNDLPIQSIFGEMDDFEIVLQGTINGETIQLTGHLSNDPAQRLVALATKRADLP